MLSGVQFRDTAELWEVFCTMVVHLGTRWRAGLYTHSSSVEFYTSRLLRDWKTLQNVKKLLTLQKELASLKYQVSPAG